MELRVSVVKQWDSGGSYVVKYEASVALLNDRRTFEVEIANIDPQDAPDADVEAAKDAILKGAESVLVPRGLGANIRVNRIVIHPVDFSPKQYERHTAEEIQRLLSDA